MLTRLIALLILSVALAVLGQDRLEATSYTRGLEQEPVHGRTIGVVDGDTIRVLSAERQQIRVRIAFIDAPEKGQPFGQRAKAAMSELVFDKEIDGQDAGLELLKAGLCWVYDKYIGRARIDIEAGYRAAQAVAQSD